MYPMHTLFLHKVVEFTSRDLVFVAGTPTVRLYIAITANSSEGPATMCTETHIEGGM